MKGMALEYVFGFILLPIFLIIAISIMYSFFGQERDGTFTPVANATYLCEFLHGGEITYEDFKNVLYGFMNGQCFQFSAKVKERITFEDIQNFVETVSAERNVIKVSDCSSPETNTNTIYVNFDSIKNKRILLFSRPVLDNDVLICD